MFLYGDQIVNDYDINVLLKHLFSIKAVRGRDYIYFDTDKIILKNTEKIKESPLCYEHKFIQVTCNYPKIGRIIDEKKKTVIDCVYNTKLKSDVNKLYTPYTIGWTFDFNHSSVINSIMNLIELIPISKRFDKKYVITFICSKIDSCNDSINGIIEGRWKSTFTGGIRPSEWRNSSHIFSERIKQRVPIKYGQCWVLADILTGIFIFLGWEARSIKISNSIMDIYDTYGVDYYKSTSDIVLKSHGRMFNPMEMINMGSISLNLGDPPIIPDIIDKGPIFALKDELEVSIDDMYNLNYFIEDHENRTWNFHVWTEVYIDNEWYILDPCPLHEAPPNFKPYKDYRSGFPVAKFFGPISINDVKTHRIPNDLTYNFRYIYACINGQMRYWCPLAYDSGAKPIMYLNQVKINEPQVYERNNKGELKNVTSRYQDEYNSFHKYHPIFMQVKHNDLTKIYLHIHSRSISNFVVQFALFYGNTPLYIHRERMSNLTPENLSFLKSPSIRKYRLKATKLTFCVYDIGNNLFWNQCIQT
jgi:hypothetical protein